MALAILQPVPTTSAAVFYQTIALTGQQAPGVQAGTVYSEFEYPPVINELGRVAFRGALAGDEVFFYNDIGIWSNGLGPLSLLVREADPVPVTPVGNMHKYVYHPSIHESGLVTFSSGVSGELIGPGSSSFLWLGGLAVNHVIAHEGMPAPGAPEGVVLDGCGVGSVNAGGQQLVVCSVDDDAGIYDTIGLWREHDGVFDLITLGGDQAPGLTPGRTFRSPGSVVMNDAGQVAFRSTITSSGGTSLIGSGIWSTRNGVLEKVAWSGDPAPGTNEHFKSFTGNDINLTIDDVGHLAFAATLTLGDTSIWRQTDAGLELVAREGDHAPGTDPGVTFNSVGQVLGSDLGHVAFFGGIVGPGIGSPFEKGIWVNFEDATRLIVRDGDPVPGTAAGSHFAWVDPFFAINGLGQIAFWAAVDLPDGTSTAGIWATDHAGEVVLIARSGQFIDVSNDPLVADIREIDVVEMNRGTPGAYSGRSAFNDAGQIALNIEFTDGSEGIFVVSIPEPGAVWLLLAGFMGLERCRRHD
ncbi:MAG: hypothetical protein R3C45_16185 [Phycisphaerales bacterium]